MASDISVVTLEEYYSGSWEDIKDVLRVLNIGEGLMDKVTQPMVNRYQEMVDRDIDGILNDTYQTPIRAFNQVVVGGDGSGFTSVPPWVENGTQPIPLNATDVTVSGKSWSSVPSTIVVTISKPAGAFNLYATVREETITTGGFIVDLSGSADVAGYVLSYVASNNASYVPVVQGATIRVFPGDVRRAARYWVAGQILVNEFQQLEANITEQATQMVSDARMQVYAFSRPTHRIPGQRRKSNISRTMPPNWQPSAFPERPN
jgi:hypothetical protein